MEEFKKKQGPNHLLARPLFYMAEGGRFELPVTCATTDFESVTFGRSDTPPKTVQKVKNLLLIF